MLPTLNSILFVPGCPKCSRLLQSYGFPASTCSKFARFQSSRPQDRSFYDSDGNQFYIKGVAYQPGANTIDPLVNTNQCKLDLSLMQTLGVNTIRCYFVDSTEDHDGCMSLFADAGIYVLIDLDSPTNNIDRTSPQWDDTLFTAFTATLDAFAQYDNLLGVFVGNEVIIDGDSSAAAPYIKAAARDIKAYRDSKNYRNIPVGYGAADAINLGQLQNYLACGSESDSIDFFGANIYTWCGESSYTASGYNELTQNASNYNIPIFFSETGCNTITPRTFDDQAAIFSDQMNSVWSGAIVYEWIEEANGYGLVSYSASSAATGTPSPVTADFTNLESQWAAATPTGTPSQSYTPSNSAPACPSSTSGVWLVKGQVTLPTISGLVFTSQSVTSSSTSHSGTSSGTASRTSSTAPAGSNGTPAGSLESSFPQSSNVPNPHSGLSTGAITAIAVVIPVVIIVIAILIFLWYRRRQRSQGSPTDNTDRPGIRFSSGYGIEVPQNTDSGVGYGIMQSPSHRNPPEQTNPQMTSLLGAGEPLRQPQRQPSSRGTTAAQVNAELSDIAETREALHSPTALRSKSPAELDGNGLAGANIDEITQLQLEQERIADERARLTRLQELDEREANLRERLRALRK